MSVPLGVVKPANTELHNVGLMLGQRHRQWSNIKSALNQLWESHLSGKIAFDIGESFACLRFRVS